MKFLTIVLISMMSSLPIHADVVGGGTLAEIMEAFRLEQGKKEMLARQPDLDKAYDVWIKSLTPADRQIILEKVFGQIIVPQVQK